MMLMIQSWRKLCATLSLLVIAYGAAGQPCESSMQDLGTLGGTYDRAFDVSADGSVVVGTSGGKAFRWSSGTGIQALSTLDGEAHGVSGDGSVIVGVSNGFRAVRWISGGGIETLGTLGGLFSWAFDVSADGSAIVGWATNANNDLRAFRWTANTGMQDLGTLGEASSWAWGISEDGSVVVGDSWDIVTDPPGNFILGRGRAFRWSAISGMQDLGLLPGTQYARAYDVSADGSVVVGWCWSEAGDGRAFRWTPSGGMQDIGTLGGMNSSAFAVSTDGNVVVGGSGNQAFIWTLESGMHAIDSLGSASSLAMGVSSDASVVVGWSENSSGQMRAVRWEYCTSGLIFREDSNSSWTCLTSPSDCIPGWDHVGLSIGQRVLESHPGYPQGEYWDPEINDEIPVLDIPGVQSVHTTGSFSHDSQSISTIAVSEEIDIPYNIAQQMAVFIASEVGIPFLTLCESNFDISCWRERLAPNRQKAIDFPSNDVPRYTCVGLIERSAEAAGLNDGQGFIDDDEEWITVAGVRVFPSLSPQLLYWKSKSSIEGRARNTRQPDLQGIVIGNCGWMITDPLGNRLGRTLDGLEVNEIAEAEYISNDSFSQYLISNPIDGLYSLVLTGLGGSVASFVGNQIVGDVFEGFIDQDREVAREFTILSCTSDLDNNGVLTFFDLSIFLDLFSSRDLVADWNADGQYNFFDLASYIADFVAGCP